MGDLPRLLLPAILSGLIVLSLAGCVLTSHRVEVRAMDRAEDLALTTPVRVHLADGSTGLYLEGLTVKGGMLVGRGVFYDLGFRLSSNNPRYRVPVEAVAAMETFDDKVNKGKTVALFPVSIPLSVIAVGARTGGGQMRTGATLENFPPATTGRGVTTSLQTRQRKVWGELIEVRDVGIVILDQKLLFVPYSAIVKADFEKVDSRYTLKEQRTPDSGILVQLRLISRFPQTLSPDLMVQLLAAHKQASLASIQD